MVLLKLILILLILCRAQTLPSVVEKREIQCLEPSVTNHTELSYEHYRLPTSVRPVSYNLTIITHLEDPTDLRFDGVVQIKLQILEDTKNITLHAKNLKIVESKIELEGLQNQWNCIKTTATNERYSYLILQLCNEAKKGEEYLLSIPFSGVLNVELRGYYRSSYLDREKNETRWLSITQFEPNGAREAFPCFDEPALKANFTVILGHHRKYTALSNMPLKERKAISDKEDWIWSEFEESVPMSTYLVAFTVNDFAFVASEVNSTNGVSFRTWTHSDAIDQATYASIVGPKVLQFYEDLFGLKFPLPKIDQIAVPDFAAGAMENWGLVTYDEKYLLFADNVSSLANKQSIVETIAHELAHQWLGNLVTMKWWNDLWLNEGFATYVSMLGMDHLHPEWRRTEVGSVQYMLEIFRVDALNNSHPISTPEAETNGIFDSITYAKGSLVLRMMHFFLGDEAFRSGVNRYLKVHAYSNAEQNDLWKAFTKSAHGERTLPEYYIIKTIMDSWTLQAGYPIITVTRDYEKRTATVTQSRYLINSNETTRTAEQSCWWVPLTYTTKSELNFERTTPKTWLECYEKGVAVAKTLSDMPANDEWVLFNLKISGIYKVKYDERNWKMLIDTLDSDDYKKIDVLNRVQLIDDAFTLALSRHQSFDTALRLIKYLRHERSYLPWKSAGSSLSLVSRIMHETVGFRLFKKLMIDILTPIYKQLEGLNTTDANDMDIDDNIYDTIQLKALIADLACRFKVDDCIARALSYFRDWRHENNPDEHNPIPTNLRNIIYSYAIHYGNEHDWNFVWERFQHTKVASERQILLSALGFTQDTRLLQRLLERSFNSSSLVHKKDFFSIFDSVARNTLGFPLARKFFVENLQQLHEMYSFDFKGLNGLLKSLAESISNRHDYEELREILEKNKNLFTKVEQDVRSAMEEAEILAQQREHLYEDILGALKRHFQEDVCR